METVRYMEVTRAQLPMGMQKRKMGSKTCQWSPSSKLWVLPTSTVQYSTVNSTVQCQCSTSSRLRVLPTRPVSDVARQQLLNIQIHVHTQKPLIFGFLRIISILLA